MFKIDKLTYLERYKNRLVLLAVSEKNGDCERHGMNAEACKSLIDQT